MMQKTKDSNATRPSIIIDMKEISPRVRINQKTCTGCGQCAEVCPFGLPIQEEGGKYKIVRPDLCTECSACKKNCPANAVIMQEQKGCGCLWDVKARRNAKNGGGGSCCG